MEEKHLKLLKEIVTKTSPVDASTKERFFEMAMTEINNNHIVLHASASSLDLENVVVVKLNDDSEKYVVAIPFKNGNSIAKHSIVTITFRNKKLSGYQEILLRNENHDMVSYLYWVDGQKVKSGNVNTKEQGLTTQSWLGCMNTCLANQGLSNWAIGLFAALCAAACGTIILCTACIEGPLLVYSVQIGNCLNYCGAN